MILVRLSELLVVIPLMEAFIAVSPKPIIARVRNSVEDIEGTAKGKGMLVDLVKCQNAKRKLVIASEAVQFCRFCLKIILFGARGLTGFRFASFVCVHIKIMESIGQIKAYPSKQSLLLANATVCHNIFNQCHKC
jgi:hypothetical protein